MTTNGDFLADMLRTEVAAKQPKGHIPLGVGLFLAVSALSPIGWLPWAVAGLVGMDAGRRLKKNRRVVEQSYSNPAVLFEALPKDSKAVVQQFSEVYPLGNPLGQKKPQPLPQARKQQLPREGASPATGAEREKAGTQGQPTDPRTATVDINTGMNGQGDGLPLKTDDGWQPQPLPAGFVEYLASQIHILTAATTGSGKTWLLRCLATYISNRGDHLVIADPKGTQWGELSPAVLRMKSGSDYTALLRDLHRELESRIELLQQGLPVGPHLWAIFDEWMLFKGKASALDPAGRAALEQRLLDIIAAGRELNMHLIMVNQSHILGDLSLSGGKNTFSSGLRDNLCTLGLGCKTTKDNAGQPMQGNSKSIDNMLRDQYLVSDAGDRTAAAAYHAELRRGDANRTFCLYASQLYIGQTPDLVIPKLERIRPFPSIKKTEPKLHGDEW
jgi:hypothetical protein